MDKVHQRHEPQCVGTSGGQYPRDGGATWTRFNTGSRYYFRGVSFFNSQAGFAVGASGAIFRTVDGGASWQQLNSGTTVATLLGISFTNARMGTVVGSDGAILRTTDGGATWASQWPAYYYTFFGVSFTDANTGTAVGANFTMAAPGSPYGADSGRILRTTDGGATWKLQYAGGFALYGVSFTDANTGTAVGQNGTILRTTDGGATWKLQSSGTTNWLWAVTFIDAKTAIVVGNSGTILRTTDTGVTWTPLPTDTRATLWGISFADAKTGIVVGDRGAVLRTVDGGVTWKTLHDNNEGGLVAAAQRGKAPGVGILDLSENAPPKMIMPEGSMAYAISPDGREIAVRTPDGKMILSSADRGESRLIPYLAAGEVPVRWGSGKNVLFVQSGEGMTVKIYRLDLVSGRKAQTHELSPADPAGTYGPQHVLLSADGKTYAYQIGRQLSNLYLVEGLK